MSDASPLENIRIIDFTHWQSGPKCTLFLACLGADVIKIESRHHLDMTRRLFGSSKQHVTKASIETSSTFAVFNYHKKSCTLNLKKPEAVELAKELVRKSDVVVENFSPGTIERLELGYCELKKVKPDIIMLSISGLGNSGPDKNYLAYAQTTHALSGLTSITGYPDGRVASVGAYWADYITAMAGAYAVLVALHFRDRTGQGQYIDLSMLETLATTLPEGLMEYIMNATIAQPQGNRDELSAPHGCYHCKSEDEWVVIAVTSQTEWRALVKAMDNPEWARQKKFATPDKRKKNEDELDSLIQEWTRQYSAQEIFYQLQKFGVKAGPTNSPDNLLKDEHLKARHFFMEVNHPHMGKDILARVPWSVCGEEPAYFNPAPTVGQHNDYVFCELLGLSVSDINRLTSQEVIY